MTAVPLEEILTLTNPAEIALVKSVLDGEKVHYVAQGENHGSLESFPVRFLVAARDVGRAREILVDFL